MKPHRRKTVKLRPLAARKSSVAVLMHMRGTSGWRSQLWMLKNTYRWMPIACAHWMRATCTERGLHVAKGSVPDFTHGFRLGCLLCGMAWQIMLMSATQEHR